jgi:hypothetical protein
MPARDGTGPTGQGPVAGGRGLGRGQGRGRGQGLGGRGGTVECVCPKCENKVPHTRGVPCSQIKCSKCGTPMRGAFCS